MDQDEKLLHSSCVEGNLASQRRSKTSLFKFPPMCKIAVGTLENLIWCFFIWYSQILASGSFDYGHLQCIHKLRSEFRSKGTDRVLFLSILIQGWAKVRLQL